MLALVPRITLFLLVLPIVSGLAGTVIPALGYFPALGRHTLDLEAWRQFLALPGLWGSLRLSLFTGLMTTALSLGIVLAFCAAWYGTRAFVWSERLLSPLLSVPHVTVAFGLAFLIAPSGWMLRMLSPWATGFTRPPDWLIVQDPYGLSLMLGLVAKEVPFLLMMTLAALAQTDARRSWEVARTFGYRPWTAWLKVVVPRVYPQIRLPVFAVLAYGVSVVDVAIILAPSTPAPLAVRLVRMFNDPELSQRLTASAGAVVLCGVVGVAVAVWCGLEWVGRTWGGWWVEGGYRGKERLGMAWTVLMTMCGLVALVVLSLAGMALWSFATHWRFPDALPHGWTLSNWSRHLSGLREPFLNTLIVATSSAVLAVVLAVGVLEQEAQSGRRCRVSSPRFLYLPLILPQVAFLFGAQVLLVALRMDGNGLALTWTHLVFVFPYVFLTLSEPYRAWDERYRRTALCLGASPVRTFFCIKAPMLLRTIGTSGAVGFAVSVGLYLPTLFAGAGRFPTVTTEAVTLSAGGDNRLIGIYSWIQMVLPLAGFGLALALPAWRFRHRRGMQVAS